MIAPLLLLAAQITPLADEPKPIATTIAAIRANPKKFDDVVRPLVPTYVEFDARVDAACIVTSCPALTVLSLRGIVSPEPPPFENP